MSKTLREEQAELEQARLELLMRARHSELEQELGALEKRGASDAEKLAAMKATINEHDRAMAKARSLTDRDDPVDNAELLALMRELLDLRAEEIERLKEKVVRLRAESAGLSAELAARLHSDQLAADNASREFERRLARARAMRPTYDWSTVLPK